MTVHCNQRVQNLERETDGRWAVTVRDAVTGERRTVRTRFVFVGAGGGALPLLQRAGIPEIGGFGGFPVSGRFLRTRSPSWSAATRPRSTASRRRRAADVGAAPGPPPDRRRPLADVRAVRRFLAEVPQGREALGPAGQRPPEQPGLDARGGADRARAHPIPDPGADAVRGRPAPDADALRAPGRGARLGNGHRGPARPGDQARPGHRPRRPPVRHRARRRRRRHRRRPARRLPRCVHGRVGDATLLEQCFPDRIPAWRPALQEAIPSYGRSLADDPRCSPRSVPRRCRRWSSTADLDGDLAAGATRRSCRRPPRRPRPAGRSGRPPG